MQTLARHILHRARVIERPVYQFSDIQEAFSTDAYTKH